MTDFFKKLPAGERGASSVLVIFMMLVLITLGALAIASANVNYKLSRRTLEWNAMYYDLDGKGEEFLFALDGKLAEAEAKALDYVTNRGFQFAEYPGIPHEVQDGIFAMYEESATINNEALNRIYMYYADTLVNELLLDFTSFQVYYLHDGDFMGGILAEVYFQSELAGHESNGLNVAVSLNPASHGISESEGTLLPIRLNNGSRYKIERWYEYQNPTHKEPASELWDGTL